MTQSRVRPVHDARVRGTTACLFTVALSLARSHVLCPQAIDVAVSGSYAYVAAHLSHSLVVVDVSNPASPIIRGSVVSSSLLAGVGLALIASISLVSAAPLPAEALSSPHSLALTYCAHRLSTSP